MAKEKIRQDITRAEAADRLVNIAQQLRDGSVSLGGAKIAVANVVEYKAETESDKLELEIKWRPSENR